MKATTLALVLVMLAGCASSSQAVRNAARTWTYPVSLPSREAADEYIAASFAGGRADLIRVSGNDYMVLYRYGSGRPITGIAIYRRSAWRWNLIEESSVRLRTSDGEEFARSMATDGVIYAIGESSGQRVILYDPESKG